MAKTIEVTWKKGRFAGYTDIFQIEDFKTDVSGVERVHGIRGPKGATYSARYRLDVHDRVARFDYKAFAAFNKREGNELGKMEFRFITASRTHVSELLWDGRTVPAMEASVLTVTSKVPVSLSEVITRDQKALAWRRLRKGQAKFRQALEFAYGARCCVSGCTVPWVLEAAHIAPYSRKQSNEVANGLLLRSDLHVLFDSHHLAINPTSRTVHFSEEAREWDEYRKLHGKKKLRGPQPGYADRAPLSAAFKARWAAFVRQHGQQ